MKRVNHFWGKLFAGLSIIVGCSLFMPHGGVKAASLRGQNNEEKIFYFLREEMHFNNAAGSGALANVEKESSFNPNASGDGGTSYGICQWHNDRMSRLRAWCSDHGYDWRDLEGQLFYLEYELETYYPNTLSMIKGSGNSAGGAYEAGFNWCYYYEIPADRLNTSTERGNLARDVYWPKYKKVKTKLSKGKSYAADGMVFKAVGDFEVAFKGVVDEEAIEIDIPNKIQIGDVTAKVVQIAANACKDNTKLETLTIGANVTKIGKTAFYGCENLQEINIKSKKIKTFSKKCFKKISDEAVFYVKGGVKKDYAGKIKKVAPKSIKVKKL
ncbi:phage tail tip lysozyme [Butyrivibrio sp. LC3010]|uniref:phage tail tip lysozyme n=1 Tax=Butyrivibrio sp. LC3010 TaxID=1280680 RepID=UPI0004020A6B|nr:phage tail tip lysozyme [Butyrivibrio sp. LC3010]